MGPASLVPSLTFAWLLASEIFMSIHLHISNIIGVMQEDLNGMCAKEWQ